MLQAVHYVLLTLTYEDNLQPKHKQPPYCCCVNILK